MDDKDKPYLIEKMTEKDIFVAKKRTFFFVTLFVVVSSVLLGLIIASLFLPSSMRFYGLLYLLCFSGHCSVGI